MNNVISSSTLQNGYGGSGYQAGVADAGNNDKIIGSAISGAGYDPAANPGACTVTIDADQSFTSRPKVHANKSAGHVRRQMAHAPVGPHPGAGRDASPRRPSL